ncbi:hypothetical protein [Actinacidiphila paucisporea]|uniref:Uncharacterized protein n=1 Tax=Actinacidiphila paucisporea TaxID=310782 RepID=A0A1M7NGI0_9ACTN|nr:hypothetical protein [Actinacidiphila paucisporea]SHN02897.1 hypothetical protein SAMN05216499_118133 [Actinacidiphila paucisporea]
MAARRRSAGRSGAAPDLEAVCDDLYTGAPGDFVARRDEQAGAAKAAGDPGTARAIRALRKPSLSAWAANLLVRRRPEEARQFLQLGEALRRAHDELDSAQMRELGSQQWRVISQLARQAAGLAQEAGHRLSDAVQREVESTLRAVIADPEAAEQWARGRLSGALTPPTDLPAAGARSAPTEPAPSKPAPPRADRHDELAERRRERQHRLAEAREAAKTAEAGLRGARKEAASAAAASAEAEDRVGQAGRAVAEAEDRVEQARRAVAVAEDRLRQAREAHAEARTSAQEAEAGRRAADDAVGRAEQVRHDASAAVERLSR